MTPLPQRQEPTQSVANDGPTVLVVEDEVIIRMVIADYLRDCGYMVIEASDADEALSVLQSAYPVDVVFTDIHMPGSTDGFGLVRWVRGNCPHIRVVMTSGVAKATDAASELCLDGPMMQKPYEPAEVYRRIQQLLATRDRSRQI